MKKSIRVICLVLVLSLFTVFALGSGSEKASENKGEETAASGENKSSSKAEYKLVDSYGKVYTDSIGTKYVKVAFSVKNTGKVNVFLKPGSADIENSNGTLEDTVDLISACPQVLKPGETGWYYENALYDGTETKNLKIVANPDVEKATDDCIRYTVSEISIKEEQYLGIKILGRVENGTDKDVESVKVMANLFDKDGKLISQESTYIDEGLTKGQKKSFEIVSLNSEIKKSDIDKYEVYAFPYQFNW